MGVFSRFLDIINANVNTLLDKAEDPEKMIRLMIIEMEDTLIELRESCSVKMASQKKASREIKDLETRINRWQKRAELAVGRKKNDLAREALLEKRKLYPKLETRKTDLTKYDEAIKTAKDDIVKLEEKLKVVKDKYSSLVEKKRVQKETDTIYEESPKAVHNYDNVDEELEKLKTLHTEDDIENKFKDMEEEAELEEEMNKLKGKK